MRSREDIKQDVIVAAVMAAVFIAIALGAMAFE